jgi:type VI secretion system protein ImpA
MSNVNIAALLEPLEGDTPAGDDLEYDQECIDLYLKAQGQPDRIDVIKDPENPGRDIERIMPGKEPDASAVLQSSLTLFKRTKDLRVAMCVVYGLTRIEGLPGLAKGTELVIGLLSQYWETVYPLLDTDEDFDPFMRINALNGFCDPAMLLRAVKGAPLAEARAIGRFTLRDIEVANGDAAPLEGQLAATPELLQAVCAEMDQNLLAERLAACRSTLANLAAMVSIFNDRTSSSPDFDPLIKILKRAVSVYDGAAPASGVPDERDEEILSDSGTNSVGRPVSTGKLASRADAKKMLEQVCAYLEQAEPAHPAPLLIRRAMRLLDMSFMEIMRELTPDAVSEIEKLGGIRDE